MFTDFKPFTDFVYHFQVADLQYTHGQQPLDKNNYALNKQLSEIMLGKTAVPMADLPLGSDTALGEDYNTILLPEKCQ